ncbi:hypothetical protein JW948_05230 [bacterium]|nr:hypothetical protein [bacterium]
MKRIIIITAIMVMAFVAAAAELTDKELNAAQKMYIEGITKGNIGLKCDAIYQIAGMKSCYPDFPTKEAEKVLQRVVQKDDNPLARAYAGLTLAYITDTSLSGTVKVANGETANDFYQRLHQAIYTQTLAMISQ